MRGEQMKKVQDYFLYFMFYSVIGWIYEVFLEVVVYRWGYSDHIFELIIRIIS